MASVGPAVVFSPTSTGHAGPGAIGANGLTFSGVARLYRRTFDILVASIASTTAPDQLHAE